LKAEVILRMGSGDGVKVGMGSGLVFSNLERALLHWPSMAAVFVILPEYSIRMIGEPMNATLRQKSMK